MAQYQTTSSHSVTIDRPACLICGSQMWLASIESAGPTHDRRTFECPVCETAEITLVKFK